MEPSHQAYELRGARALAHDITGLPPVAVFDSSFHRTRPQVAQIYALPKDVLDAGARHWGYHGISYDYISRQVPNYAPGARRVIAAHLGGGTSMCAMLDGKSIETTMGFAGVSGLPMGTRSGDVPSDLLFYLLRTKQFDDVSLEKMLYERSGLLGLSGISSDMRDLQASTDPRAAAAIEYFVYAMTKYVGAYTAVLGGLDALVFTAGIGERSATVRAGLCRALAWLGVTLNEAANASNGTTMNAMAKPMSRGRSSPRSGFMGSHPSSTTLLRSLRSFVPDMDVSSRSGGPSRRGSTRCQRLSGCVRQRLTMSTGSMSSARSNPNTRL
jgi:acetate kinase